MRKPRIGFVGLGIMGIPMAMHLVNAGYHLAVYDKSRTALQKAAEILQGVEVAQTPAEVAQAADIVITMLPSGKVVREVVLGESGLIQGFSQGALLLDTSSSEPWLTMETSRELAKMGVDMVDAPVSGAQTGAQAAELVFMVGGEKNDVSRVSPVLQTMGKKIFHLGPIGSGHIMKCINNLITAMTFMATVEGLTIGKKFSLDPDAMTDVLNVSTGMSWISQTHIRQRITSRKFDDAFKLDLMMKDINIAMELAGTQAIPLPLSAVGQHLWKAAAAFSEQGGSISNMVRWVESITGIEITSGSRPIESDS